MKLRGNWLKAFYIIRVIGVIAGTALALEGGKRLIKKMRKKK